MSQFLSIYSILAIITSEVVMENLNNVDLQLEEDMETEIIDINEIRLQVDMTSATSI